MTPLPRIRTVQANELALRRACGIALAAERENAGFSKAPFAHEMGLSLGGLEILEGGRNTISLAVLFDAARIMRISTVALLDRVERELRTILADRDSTKGPS